MHIWRITVLGVITVAGVTACSKGTSQTAAGSSSSAATAAPVSKVIACDGQLITRAEAADIVGAPIADIAPTPGDPQSCRFEATGYPSLSVTLRPGLGHVTVATWLSGKMPVSATPLPGVGERAAWVQELREVIATKNNLLCDISGAATGGPVDAAQKKIAALCNKVFAAAS
jgi:hypothetical protein